MSLISTASGLGATALYIAGAALQFRAMKANQSQKKLIMGLGFSALVLHLIMVFFGISTEEGINLSFFKVGALIALPIVALSLFSALQKPIENLFIGIFPMAAVVILSATMVPSTIQPHPDMTPLVISHIILSILAYSAITVATVHGALLLIQDHQLKARKTNGIVRTLPALQTMDQILFEMVWVGMALLTGALVTGGIYMVGVDGHHLYHKAAFSIISWLVFATLLGGRYTLGWRGTTAGRFTVAGFVFLMVAYFGSKFVLELILGIG